MNQKIQKLNKLEIAIFDKVKVQIP